MVDTNSGSEPAGDHSAGHTHADAPPAASEQNTLPKEIGGRGGPEPTRFGDWEKAGRCIDF